MTFPLEFTEVTEEQKEWDDQYLMPMEAKKIQFIAHTSAYFCYKSNRIWHEPQNIAETSGTWYITNDNGFVLPRNRGYAVFGNGEV